MKLKSISFILAAALLAVCIMTVFPTGTYAAGEAEAYYFTSDNTGIELGKTDDITFTAQLDRSRVTGLYVVDEEGHRVAQMHETSDGRYQATVSLSAEERGDHTYMLNTQNGDQYTCDMHFYKPLTEQDEARDNATWQRVSAIAGYLTKENKKSVLQSMYDVLASDKNVAEIHFENDSTINYRTQDGVMHVYNAEYTLARRSFNLEGVAEENAKPASEEVETRGTIGNKNIYIVAPDYGLDANFTLQKLYEARNAKNAMGGGTISAYYGNGISEPENAGRGDVGAFKQMSGYGMVIIDSHGVQVNNKTGICVTYTSGASSADYSAGRLVRGEDELGVYAAVMDTFITYYNSSLPNALVYIGSCFGVWASNLRTGFMSLGAATVVGYDWSVSFYWEQRVFGLFMKTLYTPNSDGSYNTVLQSFNKVKEIFGDTDSVGEKRAKFRTYGDTSITLMPSGAVSPTTPPVINPDITVSVSPEKLSMNVGDSTKITVNIEPEDVASSCKVVWSSFNEDIATVTDNGLVRAIDEGKTRIAVEVTAPGGQPVNKSVEVTVTLSGYTVTFVDGLTGEQISRQTVAEGEGADAPTPPVHDGYVFIGWDEDFDYVTEDITVKAVYAVLGDANLDGTLNTADATVVLKYAAQMIQLSAQQEKAGDMNSDGNVNTADATAILKYVATH